MEIKKSPKADLENKRPFFMEIGLIISLSLVLFTFEWTSSGKEKSDMLLVNDVVAEEEIIPITKRDETPKPPPPPAKAIEILTIVDDNSQVEEADIRSSESDINTQVEVVKMEVNTKDVEEESDEDAPIFFVVEEMPEFPGGPAAINKFIAENIKYPSIAQENGIQGKVYISFVVNAKGKVENVTVVRGVDPSLDKEAVRVIQSMPDWKPGKQRNKPVKVSYTVPVNFKLQN